MITPAPPAAPAWPAAAVRCRAGGLHRFALVALVILLGPLAGGVKAQDARQLHLYQQRLEAWFERLDRNDDGRLSPAETRGTPYLQMNFERLDRGGRGYLLPSDLVPAQQHLVGDRLRQKFLQVDRNGDGRISPAEAEAFPWLNDRFDEADRNRNGSVTLEELWQMRRSLAPRR